MCIDVQEKLHIAFFHVLGKQEIEHINSSNVFPRTPSQQVMIEVPYFTNSASKQKL